MPQLRNPVSHPKVHTPQSPDQLARLQLLVQKMVVPDNPGRFLYRHDFRVQSFLLITLRMPHDMPLPRTGPRLPPRTFPATTPTGVESQPRHRQKDMPSSHVNGNPFTPATIAIMEKSPGRHLPPHEPGFSQNIRNRARAIITAVIEHRMSAPPLIRFILKTVSRRDGPMHRRRSSLGSVGYSIL